MNFNVLFGTNVFFYICLDIYTVSEQLNYYYHATGIYVQYTIPVYLKAGQ